MTPCHVHETSIDPLDPFEQMDLDDAEDNEYYEVEAVDPYSPFCDFHNGDSDGFCIKERFGCCYEGCPKATQNG